MYIGDSKSLLHDPNHQAKPAIYPYSRKINMEAENDGLEDDFPFPEKLFSGSMLIFRGVVHPLRLIESFLDSNSLPLRLMTMIGI